MKNLKKKRTLLIIEDEKDQRMRLKTMLENSGYTVDAAETGDEAVAMIKNNSYDLVLTDIRMPGVADGLDMLRLIKNVNSSIEVIILSAYGTVESAVRAMANGAFDFVQKPVVLPELQIKIERALRHRDLKTKPEAWTDQDNDFRALSPLVNRYQNRLYAIQEECAKMEPLFDFLRKAVKNILALCREK